jgi:hypothetical protein
MWVLKGWSLLNVLKVKVQNKILAELTEINRTKPNHVGATVVSEVALFCGLVG